MNKPLSCHRDVVNLWKRAADLAQPLQVGNSTVCAWRWNGIPPEHFPAVVEHAKLIGHPEITIELLYALAPIKGKRGRPRAGSRKPEGAAA